MRVLLDTHIALWALAESSKLPEELVPLLESRDNLVCYSIVSVWEVAIKHAIHPESMPMPEEDFVKLCEQTGFVRLPLEPSHVYAVKTLSRERNAARHNDPFDRLLIAQAKVEGLTFATHDQLLPAYRERCITLF